MLDFSIYLLYRAGTAIVSVLPLRLLFAAGEFLGLSAWVLLRRYRRLACDNLRIAFGTEKSKRELRRLARGHFQRLGANLLCSVKLTGMPVEEILRRIEIENIEAMNREFRAGVPVVLVLSHLGTWELFAQLMPKLVDPVPASSVYQKLGNRFIDAHVHRTRSRTGLRLFDRKEGFQPVIEQQIRHAPEDWFWVHNRWKTPRPNFLLTQYKRGVHLPPDVSANDLKPFRILIRSSNWLGDAIMSVPAVRAIKSGRPDAYVAIAALAKIVPVWKLVSEVDE